MTSPLSFLARSTHALTRAQAVEELKDKLSPRPVAETVAAAGGSAATPTVRIGASALPTDAEEDETAAAAQGVVVGLEEEKASRLD